MKIRRKKLFRLLFAVICLYIGSYLVMSIQGYYKPTVFGLAASTDGKTVLVPKTSLDPYLWHPFEVYNEDGNLTIIATLYYPLLMADTRFIHRSELADTGRYRVISYFDWDERAYRNVNPE